LDDRTVEILNRFYDSWAQTKVFFDDLITKYKSLERLIPVREFIDDLEQAGGK